MSTTGKHKRMIGDKLAYIQTMLERRTDLESYEENHDLEDVICTLLNLAYGFELKNLNRETPNHPAVDLGDKDRRICVQVTSTKRRDKITQTLACFERQGLSKTYSRVIVFVLGDRKNFAREFSSDTVSFFPERDLMDFSTLVKQIKHCNADTVMKIYDYLENEYPTTGANSRWIKKLCLSTGCLLLLALLSGICMWLYENFAPPEYIYETETDWLTMHEAAYILGSGVQSSAAVYTNHPDTEEFYSGTALTILYHNLDEQQRTITDFTVYADNIVENLSPRLYYSTTKGHGLNISYSIHNYGWGETGDIQIDFVSLTVHDERLQEHAQLITLREDAPRSWVIESIYPGEEIFFVLLREDDFVIDYSSPLVDSIEYELVYELYAPAADYRETLQCILTLQWNPACQSGAPSLMIPDTTYVVWVESSEPTWTCTYPIQQTIPGNETVRFPFFIVPKKSCTMTVRIQFETLDGEIIETTVLENAEFIVPYYSDSSKYVSNTMLDWDQVSGKIVVFPTDSDPYIYPKGG